MDSLSALSVHEDSKSYVTVSVSDVLTLLGILLTIFIWWDSQQMETRLTGVIQEESENKKKQMRRSKRLSPKQSSGRIGSSEFDLWSCSGPL